jgi:hypothetical protein
MNEQIVEWTQVTLRRRIRWNLTRKEIALDWQPKPGKNGWVEVDRFVYPDDASAWTMLVDFMTPNSYIGPKDWRASS